MNDQFGIKGNGGKASPHRKGLFITIHTEWYLYFQKKFEERAFHGEVPKEYNIAVVYDQNSVAPEGVASVGFALTTKDVGFSVAAERRTLANADLNKELHKVLGTDSAKAYRLYLKEEPVWLGEFLWWKIDEIVNVEIKDYSKDSD